MIGGRWKARKRGALLGMVGAALLLAAVLAPQAQARYEAFEELSESPAELTSVAADPNTGLVYAQENSGYEFIVYDPRTDLWSELASAPLNSGNNGGATYYDGKVYTSYTENSEELGVYDIALNSWSTIPNPLGDGTGDIVAANGKLYMAVGHEFISLDLATNVVTTLAEPPSFEPAGNSNGFERWGGLQIDGDAIYGHQGNSANGFGVYSIGGNAWTELTPLGDVEEGEGAVLGSALDPVAQAYLAYGDYGGTNLYRWDIEGGFWDTTTLPFSMIGDGGMAYVGLAGHEGVYMSQGEDGTEFFRYVDKNVTDLSASMSASVAATSTGGDVTYSIGVKNNGPERAGDVKVSDALPSGTSLASAGSSQGSCNTGSTVTCSIGALASGASATVTIKVAAAPGSVTNSATVSSGAIDTDSGNDSASATVTVPTPAATTTAKCTVPKLRGLKVKGAKKALRKANCAPGKVKHVFSKKVKKGRVVSSGRKKGKVLAAGTKVNLVVSKGAKPKAHH